MSIAIRLGSVSAFLVIASTSVVLAAGVSRSAPPVTPFSDIASAGKGRLLGVGATRSGRDGVIRLLPSGRIDRSFSLEGVRPDGRFRGFDVVQESIAVQSDGDLVAGCQLIDPDSYHQSCLWVSPSDGKSQGRITPVGRSGNNRATTGVAVGPADEIAMLANGPAGSVVLYRFKSNGTLNRSFGRDGRRQFSWSIHVAPKLIAFDARGGLIIATFDRLYRLDQRGRVDHTFAGSRGALSFKADDLALDSRGRIVAGGSEFDSRVGNTTYRYRLARFRRDGTLDSSFGGNGFRTVRELRPPRTTSAAMAVSGTRIFVAIGGSPSRPREGIKLLALKGSGRIDQHYGSHGERRVRIPGQAMRVSGALASAGKILVSVEVRRSKLGLLGFPRR